MLKINDLYVNYGGIEALKGINMDIEEGKIVSLIGANGAGKSTTLKSISGLVKVKSGKILFNDIDITGKEPSDIVKTGIVQCPEGRHVFPDMTVLDNIKIGAYLRNDDISKDINKMFEMFPILKERHWQLAGTLSGGEQQMLAVARCLMARPKIMMLDEPSLGLAPLIVQEIFDIIKKINNNGITILLIEQNANMALKISDKAYVLETGKIVMEGSGKDLLNDEHVKEAYLGKKSK